MATNDPDEGRPDDGNPFKGTPFEQFFGSMNAGQMPDLGQIFGQLQSLLQPYDGPLNWDFALDLALGQMRKLRSTAPAENNLTRSLVRRATAAKLTGDYGARAARLVEQSVYPALDRQIAAVTQLRTRARAAAGQWAAEHPGAAPPAMASVATPPPQVWQPPSRISVLPG